MTQKAGDAVEGITEEGITEEGIQKMNSNL